MTGASRRLLLLLLFAVLAAIVLWTALDIWAGRRVDAEYARLEKRYGSLDGRSVVAHPVAPEFNSARFVRAAAALTVNYVGGKGYGALMASFTQFEKMPESSPIPGDVRAFIDANRDAMGLADQARSRHQSSWDADYGVSGGAEVPRWLTIRSLGNALYFAARLDARAGRPDDAAQKAAAGLAVSASLRQEPTLIGQLIRIWLAMQQCEPVERLITQSEPSRASLEDLATSLAETRTPDPMYVGVLAELRTGNTERMRDEKGPLRRIARPFLRWRRVRYLQDMERLLQVQAGPRPRPAFASAAPSSEMRGLHRAIGSGDTFNNVLGVTQLGVALRRYRLDHGTYPDDLSSLVPDYVSRLPIDAFTGRPPSYGRSGAGFTLKAESGQDAPPNPALDWSVPR